MQSKEIRHSLEFAQAELRPFCFMHVLIETPPDVVLGAQKSPGLQSLVVKHTCDSDYPLQ